MSIVRFAIILVTLFAVSAALNTNPTLAQDSDGPPDPTGELIVTPQRLVVGETTLAFANDVDPSDTLVVIEHGARLAPEDQSCDGSAATSTAPATSWSGDAWVTLTACSAGSFNVRLVASGTGRLIDEQQVTISEPGATGEQAQAQGEPGVSHSGVDTRMNAGDSDKFDAYYYNLDASRQYPVGTRLQDGAKVSFDSGCNPRDNSTVATIRSTDTETFPHTMYACESTGTQLVSWIKVSGDTLSATANIAVKAIVKLGSNKYTVTEGGSISIPVKLVGASTETPTVSINASPGYSVPNVRFGEGDTSESFTITAKHDCDDDEDESDNIEVSIGRVPSNVAIGSPSSATITVKEDGAEDDCDEDDDELLVSFGSASYSGSEGDDIHVQVRRTRQPDGQVTVSIGFSGTADNRDYTLPNLTDNEMILENGTTAQTFTIRATDDARCEGSETVVATITSVSRGDIGTPSSTTATIASDASDCTGSGDPLVSLGASTYSVDEGGGVTIRVNRTQNTSRVLTAPVTVSNGTASAEDYSVSGLPSAGLSFADEESSKTFQINADDDDECEGGETVRVVLGAPSRGATSSPASAVVTINRDAGDCVPSVGITASPTSIEEGQSTTFTVSASPAPTSVITATLNQETEGDFLTNSASSSVTLSSRVTLKAFTLNTEDDDTYESNGWVKVTVSAGSGYEVDQSASSTTVTITDNDLPPVDTEVQFEASSYSANEGGSSATVRVHLNRLTDGVAYTPITFKGSPNYSTEGLVNRRLRFADNSSSASFIVRADRDNNCSSESVTLGFGSLPAGFVLGSRTTATVTLVDRVCVPAKPAGLAFTPTRTKGSVDLDWNDTTNARSYNVLHCRPAGDPGCDFEPAGTASASSARVGNLDVNEIHRFVIQAVSRTGHTRDSDEIEVNLKPPPSGLTGEYVSLQHRRVTLTWDPVPNPDVADDLDGNYHVEQLFGTAWRRLTNDHTDNGGVFIDSITVDSGKVTVVVRGLAPGDNYQDTKAHRHRVRADSVQGLSDPSGEVETDVVNEQPTDAPSNVNVSEVIGGRGYELSWRANVARAEAYFVRLTPDTAGSGFWSPNPALVFTETRGNPWVNVTTGGQTGIIKVRAYGLDESEEYTLSVLATNGSGNGPDTTTRKYSAPVVLRVGHQADHQVKYTKGTIGSSEVELAVDTEVTTWNKAIQALGKDLHICTGAGCSDSYEVDVYTVNDPNNNATSSQPGDAHCGASHACVKPTFGSGGHRQNSDMVFANPPFFAHKEYDAITGAFTGYRVLEYEWTTTGVENAETSLGSGVYYASATRVVRHEFGHTFGLPDFYQHSATEGLKATIMHSGPDITDEHDVDQLRAIYYAHNKH